MTNEYEDDPIVAEVRKARQDLLARFNNDLEALVQHLQLQTLEDTRAGHPTVDLPPRRPTNWQPSKKVG